MCSVRRECYGCFLFEVFEVWQEATFLYVSFALNGRSCYEESCKKCRKVFSRNSTSINFLTKYVACALCSLKGFLFYDTFLVDCFAENFEMDKRRCGMKLWFQWKLMECLCSLIIDFFDMRQKCTFILKALCFTPR